MKTLDRRQDEFGIRRIAKIVDDGLSSTAVRRLSESDANRIVKLIDDCCSDISNESTSDFNQSKLVNALRSIYGSDYCAIGKVDGDFAEDCIVSWVNKKNEKEYRIQERDLRNIKRVSLDNQNCCVCIGLKSTNSITFFGEDEITEIENYSVYKSMLGEVRNTTIIPVRNKNNQNKGYIQLINSNYRVDSYDIRPLNESLLIMILLILQHDELKKSALFKKDYDFISKIQNKINDVDSLLKDIMEYLSEEFNAGVISFRIPLLVGTEKKPLFFLRECYIREEIAQYYNRDDYFRERLVKTKNEMGGYDKLTCNNIDSVIFDKAKNNDYYKKIEDKGIRFRDDTLIIPVLRDYSENDECFHPNKDLDRCCLKDGDCHFRFAKYFGFFKLRILKPNDGLEDEEVLDWLAEESKNRLANLAKHISILLNAIVEKNENKSLDEFQKELKGTSFTKIKAFDEQCSAIVKKAINSQSCTIYRYKNGQLLFSASSDSINYYFYEIIAKFGEHSDNLEKTLFVKKEPIYFVRCDKDKYNSILLVPMIRKDNSKLGVMVLVGKDGSQNKDNLSRTFWEHDKKHIEYIVNVLTRIEESDSERLTFLAQLSHELLRPVTEMVYRNDYHIATATRNPEAYPKRNLVKEMQKNVDMCMVFKYIIDDVEFIYSSSKGDVAYNFEMADFKVIILNAIRFFEEDAAATKQITIKTYLKNMPDMLYIDKSRMMQVVINLLKNAIQYSDYNEVISISYEFNEMNNCHEINFSDRGIPVIQKEKDSIFELFARSKIAVETKPNGSGIGLYLVKQIMRAHGGDCYVKEFNFPTTFTIQIPNII